MAELVVSMVVGPLLSLVKEKASSYLLEQYKVMEGMEAQHKILMRKLPAILDVITDAEEKATRREGVKAWLKEVKTVAYEANEAFDEFSYEALRREAKEKGHIRKLGFEGVKLFPTHNRVAFRNRMGNKLRRIVQTIEVLVTEMNTFGFNYQNQAPSAPKQWRETDSSLVDSENIATKSRDVETQKIVKMLIDRASVAELTVLPIVGMGGLGKTTLAQLIYNHPDVKKHFEPCMWVCVSDEFDVCKLSNKICNNSEKNLEEAQKKLQDELKGKRYLLVLDDVWNEDGDKWEKLKASLRHGGNGCVVLTTTRKKRVVELMGTVKAHDIALLDDEFMKKIIETKAFDSQENRPTELLALVDGIVERCGGSPLAANALGSVLRGKTSPEEWKAVLSKSIAHNKEDKILPILKLSYDDLPSYMKQCFSFCAVFPKDFEINMEALIQLWMANGFVPKEKDIHLETTGKHIFEELVSRSFFQDVKQVRGSREDNGMDWYCPMTTFKIHDLMHDVALSAMENEVATITDEKPEQNGFLQNTCRHIILLSDEAAAILNSSLKTISPAIQTLLCKSIESSLHHLEKYSSLRALLFSQSKGTFLLKPKYLRHLRYLDVSCSEIELLPEDISILYHLHTLNVSYCQNLRRLPTQMKYMTALRHLYTHECGKLKGMPPKLGQLTSLQTLTNFVVGTGSDCSSIEELQHLSNLGGSLLLTQLENVTEAIDAKMANLGNKKELTALSLRWTATEEGKPHCQKVLEGLEAPHGLEALRINDYQGTSFPTWMGMLPNMVELYLYDCKKSKNLPPLGQVTTLQVLCLEGLGKLECLCTGSTFFNFPNLKELTLVGLHAFDRWCEVNWLQGEQVHQIMFPRLEKLSIRSCQELIALPEAPLLEEFCGVHYKMARSAFPALKMLELSNLDKFQKWETADEAIKGQQIIFPLLENILVYNCQNLIALPEGPLLHLCGGDYGNGRSAFPALKELQLIQLENFERWEQVGAPQGEDTMFPHLEELSISSCPKMTALPAVGRSDIKIRSAFPKLKKLNCCGLKSFKSCGLTEAINGEQWAFPDLKTVQIDGSPELTTLPVGPNLISIEIKDGHPHLLATVPRVISSLSELEFHAETSLPAEHGGFELVDNNNIKCPLTRLKLVRGCNLFFHLWTCFVQLQDLTFECCDTLIYWPEDEFQSLVSLRNLSICNCNNLTGYARLAQGQPASERSQLLPNLEYLCIWACDSLVEVFNVPASLKTMKIGYCPKVELESIFGKQQDRATLNQGLSTDVMALAPTTAVPQLPSSTTWLFLPCLVRIHVTSDSLSEIVNLPSSIREIHIERCDKLQLLSGQLDALRTLWIAICPKLRSLESSSGPLQSLELLYLVDCESLAPFLSNGPQAYSSLRRVVIGECPGIKSLPSSMRQRLDSLDHDDSYVEARYYCQGAKLLKPKTWKYASCRN